MTDKDDLVVLIEGLGQIKIANMLITWGHNWGIDEIAFADSSPSLLLLDTIVTTYGTEAGETIQFPTGHVHPDKIVYGYGGDDTITTGTGNDVIFGGDGADTIAGGLGHDTLHGDDGDDTLKGQKGDDVLYGGAGTDTLYGDETRVSGSYNGTNMLYGEEGDDTLYGAKGSDTLIGGSGDDLVHGSGGNDLYVYHEGLDTFSELINGTHGGGTDTIWISGGITISDVSLSDFGTYDTKIIIDPGVDEIRIVEARYYYWADAIEILKFDDGFEADLPSYNSWLKGTSGNDIIAGNANANVLIGYAGDDYITAGGGADQAHGGAGADTLYGGSGNDLLHGGDGDDVLNGEDGLDTLYGGAGADSFMFETASAFNDVDEIMDFSLTDDDVLNLVDVLGSVYDPLQDAITDFVQITDDGTDSTLAVDADGGADNFVAIAMLRGVTGLTDEAALETNGHLLAA